MCRSRRPVVAHNPAFESGRVCVSRTAPATEKTARAARIVLAALAVSWEFAHKGEPVEKSEALGDVATQAADTELAATETTSKAALDLAPEAALELTA